MGMLKGFGAETGALLLALFFLQLAEMIEKKRNGFTNSFSLYTYSCLCLMNPSTANFTKRLTLIVLLVIPV